MRFFPTKLFEYQLTNSGQYPTPGDVFTIPVMATLHLRLVNRQSLLPASNPNLVYKPISLDTALENISSLNIYANELDNYLNNLIRVGIINDDGFSNYSGNSVPANIGNNVNITNVLNTTPSGDSLWFRTFTLDLLLSEWIPLPMFQQIGWIEGTSSDNDNKVAGYLYQISDTVGNGTGFIQISVYAEASYNGLNNTDELAAFILRILFLQRKTFNL